MKKETQIKIVEGAINCVVNALFGKLNDGPNFDLLENYKTENFFKGFVNLNTHAAVFRHKAHTGSGANRCACV